MRHPARRNADDLLQRVGRQHRDRRGHRIAVQVEVHDVEKLAVRGHADGGRKHAERRAREHFAVRRVFPDRSERLAVRERDEVALSIRRDRKAVRPIDVVRHDAGIDRPFDPTASGSEPDERDLIGRLRGDEHEVLGVRGFAIRRLADRQACGDQ
jgi:hypothetical protein